MHTRNIFEYEEPWKSGVAASMAAHGVLAVLVVLAGYYSARGGQNWGGSARGEAMSATLVSSAIPLPRQPSERENVLANESKGLSQSEPAKAPEPEPEAVAIPDRASKTKAPTKTKTEVRPTQQRVDNIIPYGQGGPASQPYTLVKTAMGTGGVSMGQDGAFGSRYAWYVDAVRRKISENWFKYEVDPNISYAARVYVTFDIGRNGQPGNIQISQSSGVPSLDISAKRALQRIDTFGPLPNDYAGGKVSVEFWFDYKR